MRIESSPRCVYIRAVVGHPYVYGDHFSAHDFTKANGACEELDLRKTSIAELTQMFRIGHNFCESKVRYIKT